VHNTSGSTFAPDLHVDWKGFLSGDPDVLRKILRESGQALGLPYEWFRGTPQEESTQAPTACLGDLVRQPAPSWSPPLYGLLDYYSVMDRCTPTSLITRPGPSPADVIGLQKLYGTKPDGAVVGYRGGAASASSSVDGASIISFPVRRSEVQFWSRPPSATWPAFETTVSGQHRCMSVSGNTVSQGFTPVHSESCQQVDGQRFEMKSAAWRAEGNMCVKALAGEVLLAFCDETSVHQWNFFDIDPATEPTWDMIQYNATGWCVTVQTTSGAMNEQAVLAPCNAADPRQHFQYRGNGFIGYGSQSTPLCLNVLLGDHPASGKHIGLWTGCDNPVSFNSQFFVSGNIKALGQCLSTRPMAGNYGELGVEPCSAGSVNQVWDFHF
jgi:hypothetical protein